jgi:hypothetical protein
MPPLPPGESAECDSDFLSRASVRGQPRRIDATHATLTITQVIITLQLRINIGLPAEATQILAEHDDGHRQIAEYYYQTADKLVEQIASTYIGKQLEVTPLSPGSSDCGTTAVSWQYLRNNFMRGKSNGTRSNQINNS